MGQSFRNVSLGFNTIQRTFVYKVSRQAYLNCGLNEIYKTINIDCPYGFSLVCLESEVEEAKRKLANHVIKDVEYKLREANLLDESLNSLIEIVR